MEKKTLRRIKWLLLIFSFTALIIFSIVFYAVFLSSHARIQNQNEYNPADTCLYHVIITGSYENQSFLTDVYKGAAKHAESYKTIVDLHVPNSQADTKSLQSLLDYCSFMNADGIIVYLDSADNPPSLLTRQDSPVIPLITTGQFSPTMEQASFIGINNWELGKKIADEAQSLLPEGGKVFILDDSNVQTSSSLMNGIQTALQDNPLISTNAISNISPELTLEGSNNIFISLTEDDTILTAQQLSESFDMYSYMLIGFGGNEVCQLYLQKGWITKLVSLDHEKIGETAIRELFEYRTKGYANSYITADVKISSKEK